MPEGYTIHIFVPDGDPEGLRIIDRMNWTGRGYAFPRSIWERVRTRTEMNEPGVYILIGHAENSEDPNDERPVVYVGQADNVRRRVEDHTGGKDFWDRAVVFISTNHALDRSHITWLEHALIAKAARIGLCRLDNGTSPQEPSLSEWKKADTHAFLREMLEILPLVNVNLFEEPKAVAVPHQHSTTVKVIPPQVPVQVGEVDTVVVPAWEEGFQKVFIGEQQWRSIRIGHHMLAKIRYCAAYVTNPVSAITHYAPVERIEPSGEGSKYRLIFSEPAQPLPHPIPFADAPSGTMQGPRYTTFAKLKSAKKLTDLF